MDYGSHVISELRDAMAFEAWRAGQSATAMVEDKLTATQLRRLALLRSDLMPLGATLAIVTSLANWRVAMPQSPSLLSMTSFQPAPSSRAEASIAEFESAPMLFEFLQHWQNLTARLLFAQSLTRDAGALSPREFDVVADAWQRAARAWLGCHGEVVRVMAQAGLRSDSTVEAHMMHVLQRCALGDYACIGADGSLEIQGWAERRCARRHQVDLAVHVEAGTALYPAMLRNVSATGMMLAIRDTLPASESLTIILPDQRRLDALLVWQRDGRAGIALSEQLEVETIFALMSRRTAT